MEHMCQRRSNLKRGMAFFLCITMLGIWGWLPEGMLSLRAEAASYNYVFGVGNDQYISINSGATGGTSGNKFTFPTGDSATSKKQTFALYLKSDDGNTVIPVSGTSISLNIESANTAANVVQVQEASSGAIDTTGQFYDLGTGGAFNVVRVGPGTASLSGQLNTPEGYLSFEIQIETQLNVNRNDNYNPGVDIGYVTLYADHLPDNRTLILPYPGAKQQIKLKDILNLTPGPDGLYDYNAKGVKVNWYTSLEEKGASDESVIKVDSNGIVTAVGSGMAYVNISTEDGNQDKSVRVLVPLNFGDGVPSIPIDPYKGTALASAYSDFSNRLNGTADGIFTFYSTAFSPENTNNIKWTVTDERGRVVDEKLYYLKKIPANDALSNGVSKLQFSASRAGTYTITGTLTGRGIVGDLSYFKSVCTVTVPVDFADKSIVMNKGDRYDIIANTNLPGTGGYSFTVSPDGINVVSVNSRGQILAKNSGRASVICRPNVAAGTDDAIVISVHVIDSISLNVTDQTMYVGGVLDLEAMSTNYGTPVEWEVEDTSVLKISEEGGQFAVITALKPGTSKVTVRQVVNGVTKEASCNITVIAAVTSIKVTPAEVDLAIGEATTLVAAYTPNIPNGVELYWKSSDDKVVKVEDINNRSKTCTIMAAAAGTAVIMAINKENVVVGSAKVIVRQPVEKITISETSLTLPQSAGKYQLFAAVSPDTATNKKVNWKSSNTAIATVDANGVVTILKYGTVTIIAMSDDKPGIMAMCEIKITEGVTGIILDDTKLTLETGESYRLTYIVTPETASNRSVNFASMNPKVASVDSTGRITAKSAGVTYITVTTTDGSYSQICTVTVEQSSTSLKLDTTKLVLDVGESYTLEPTFNPKTATLKTLRFASSDTSVAKVDSKGRVTAVKEGESIITVTTSNNITVFCYVTVNQPVTGIRLDYEEYTLDQGDEFTLSPEILPSSASNQNVTWTSSGDKIASVDDEGTVKGIKGGAVVITCTTEEGGYVAVCMVTVNESVNGLKLNKSTYKLGLGKKYTLTAKATNSSASNQKIKWVSSNPKVCTVNKNGLITGKKLGNATVTAYAQDGSGAEASCEVRVVLQATSVSLNTNILNMVVGESERLRSSVRPSNATYSVPKYTSDNTEVALVDSNGKVTAVGPGTCKIIATAKDSSGLLATCVVIVRPYVSATGLTLSQSEITMGIGATETISYSLKPNDSTDKVSWASNNRAVATVGLGNGIIKAISPGTAVVTARTSSGKTATVRVTVVGLNFNSYTMEQYDSYMLRVIGADGNILWDVDNSDICTVVGGLVTAKKSGTTYVTARVNGAALRCRITVTDIGQE